MPDTTPLYPLRFQPLFRRYLWGGRTLADVLAKTLPPGNDYAESWEVVDRPGDQSSVAAGPLAGTTLGQLVQARGRELLGRHHPQDRFPLLLKFLDAQQTLSVQVHPNDAQAARQSPPDLGKTEAWVILSARPGSKVYAGLKTGVDRAALARHLHEGTAEQCLHSFSPQAGDCIFMPAGVVHALGSGLLVAEIQQSSDTTFRLFDWNRVGPDGKSRPLHIEQALAVIDFSAGPVSPVTPSPAGNPAAQTLVACDKFLLQRWRTSGPVQIGGDNRCTILAVTAGSVRIAGDPTSQPLSLGQVALLPAALGPTTITPQAPCELLIATIA